MLVRTGYQRSIKHINKLSKSKWIINQISFQILQKSHVILLNENIKYYIKEKYYINKKTHLATDKNFVLHHSKLINGEGGS